jgi:hypothetical protein
MLGHVASMSGSWQEGLLWRRQQVFEGSEGDACLGGRPGPVHEGGIEISNPSRAGLRQ